jgi:metal-sulfur cluster biosynthetic enzyme
MATDALNEAAVLKALRQVIDPEIGINIVDLGLVYGLRIQPDEIEIDLSMTTPACPLGDLIMDEARRALKQAAPDRRINIRLVWTPIWGPERMSDAAKATLGW